MDAGVGVAQLNAGSFTQTTSYGEVLKTTDTRDAVGFAKIGFGYQFDENWAIVLSVADYATAEVKVSFPWYPGVLSILPMPSYSRNVLKYETTRFTLVPSYTYELSDKLRVRGGAGATCSRTDSHFETTYYAVFSGPPAGTFSESYAKERKTSWSYVVSLGAEYALTKNLSIGITGDYSPYKIKVTPTRVVGLGAGTTQPSKSTVNIDSFEAFLSINYRR